MALAIQKHGSGQKIRRLTLFQLIGRSAESSTSRGLVTNSNKYGLTTGGYTAEYLELTPDGYTATVEDVSEREKIRARFKLAIERIPPFKKLHDRYLDNRLPAKNVMVDFLKDDGMNPDVVSECVETFLLNAKFINILQNIAGAERLVSLDHVLDQAPTASRSSSSASPKVLPETANLGDTSTSFVSSSLKPSEDPLSNVCFYITPIGLEESESRMHSSNSHFRKSLFKHPKCQYCKDI